LFRHSNFNIVSEIFGGKSIEIPKGEFIDSRTALMHHGYDAGLVDEDDVFTFVVFFAGREVVVGPRRIVKDRGAIVYLLAY
jgi:hypothetical protein